MKLLDLCCRVGGASTGYHRAGFDEIVGWDLEPIDDYPFHLVVGDITTITPDYLDGFDAVHISPPCQSQTALTSVKLEVPVPDHVEPYHRRSAVHLHPGDRWH